MGLAIVGPGKDRFVIQRADGKIEPLTEESFVENVETVCPELFDWVDNNFTFDEEEDIELEEGEDDDENDSEEDDLEDDEGPVPAA